MQQTPTHSRSLSLHSNVMTTSARLESYLLQIYCKQQQNLLMLHSFDLVHRPHVGAATLFKILMSSLMYQMAQHGGPSSSNASCSGCCSTTCSAAASQLARARMHMLHTCIQQDTIRSRQ